MIPIRLTAVAAQPLMGILVFILADQPFAPVNYRDIEVDPSEILFDGGFQPRTNYFEWVARTADEAEGNLFVTEYIGTNPLRAMGHERTHLSRYYTRINPHQMTQDPVFMPYSELGRDPTSEVSNLLDLSDHPTLWGCHANSFPSECAFNYCGQGGTCVEDISGVVGCQCDEGLTAQRIMGPDGTPRVTCVPEFNPYGVTDTAAGVGSEFDPCDNVQCGAGTCVQVGGFPTCQCDSISVATLDVSGTPSCRYPSPSARTFGPGAGLESRGESFEVSAARAMVQSRQAGFDVSLWLLVGIVCLMRVRKRP